jgi:5'-nucleotidase/UDP-sugar diphosphatase
VQEQQDATRAYLAGEVTAHTYRGFPLDAIWCDDEAHSWRPNLSTDLFRAAIQPRIQACTAQEDQLTTWLLEPYIINETVGFELARIFAFAPKQINRYNTASGGDSALGNLVAESMRVREGIQAEVGMTNSLGIRDDLYAGPINLEDMFNVFPFENTINLQFLSGVEMHNLFDYNAAHSATRGCQTQAQVAGAKFTMDCATAILNQNQTPCMTAQDCQNIYPRADSDIRAPWQCQFPIGTPQGAPGICYAEESYGISINDQPLDLNSQYKVAPNNYIAHGGSGFKVLKRNTTTQETNISLRDGLIEYFQQQCNCDEINKGSALSAAGLPCATVIDASVSPPATSVDPAVSGFCNQVAKFDVWLQDGGYNPNLSNNPNPIASGACTCDRVLAATAPDGGALTSNDPCYNMTMYGYCTGSCPCNAVLTADAGLACSDANVATLCNVPLLNAGACTCTDVLLNNQYLCQHITPQLVSFCKAPGNMPMVVGETDGRIQARVQ